MAPVAPDEAVLVKSYLEDSHTDYTSLLGSLQIAEAHHDYFIKTVKKFRAAYKRSNLIKTGTGSSYNTFSHRFLGFFGEKFWGNDRQYLQSSKQGDAGFRYSKADKKNEAEMKALLTPLWTSMREKMFTVVLPTRGATLVTRTTNEAVEQTKDGASAGDIDEQQSASPVNIAQAALALLEDSKPDTSKELLISDPNPLQPLQPRFVQIGQILTASAESSPLTASQIASAHSDVNTFAVMKRQDRDCYAYIMYRIFFETIDGNGIEADSGWIPAGDRWARKYENMQKDDGRKWALTMEKLYELFRG